MTATAAARTYNQSHTPRKYTPGRRRVSIYVAWSFPAEAGRNTAELDNRFSTMTEVRRVEWPNWEAPQFSDPLQFQQGIGGGLELFLGAWPPFRLFIGEVTGHVVPVHDVGVTDDPEVRKIEYLHHGDALMPRQQRVGRYTRSLTQGLGIPVENRRAGWRTPPAWAWTRPACRWTRGASSASTLTYARRCPTSSPLAT